MKVALAFPGCHTRGGVERIILECARYLVRSGHDVHVFASEFGPDADTGGFRQHLVRLPRRPWFLRGATFFRECTASLRNLDYDVLNTHGCVCPTGGVHWVQSLHAAWLERSRRFRPAISVAGIKQRLNPLHPILLRLEERHFRHRAYARVIATTEQVRRDLHSFYGVPAEDVEIVPNGFSPNEFSPSIRSQRRVARRKELGLADNEIALLFAANELERKGYPVLLSAMRILGRKDVKLLVVGRTSMTMVRQLADSAGLSEQVIACGSTGDMAGFHAATDLFVLPTQYEAFCLAILESLGSGLPVITTDIPGARDAILPNVNGLIVKNPLDAEELAHAIRLGLDHDLRQRWSNAAPQSVAQYQWPNVLARYEQILLDNQRSTKSLLTV
jgi:UDP-glucose:(heptosyl)LPS alpha-1,3-glucosyltransferase